jgi:hypothetical protein
MKEYRVLWEIELEASTPEEAAQLARELQLDPESFATFFIVQEPDGTEHEIEIEP